MLIKPTLSRRTVSFLLFNMPVDQKKTTKKESIYYDPYVWMSGCVGVNTGVA